MKKFTDIWEKIKKIDGHLVSPMQEEWLFNAASKSKADILEIGSYKGRSTCCLAMGCPDGCKVYTIDPFDGGGYIQLDSVYYDEFLNNLDTCGVKEKVVVLKGLSKDFVNKEFKLGLMFIDGSHLFEDVVFDFHSYFPAMLSGGVVVVHDVVASWPGCFNAWHKVIKQELKNTKEYYMMAYGEKP